jgi:hypothetical protein
MKRRVLFFVNLALIVAMVLVFMRAKRSAPAPSDPSRADVAPCIGEPQPMGRTRPADETVVKPEPTTRLDDGPVVPPLDRAKRDAMRALIWQAFGRPAPEPAPLPTKAHAYVLPVRPNWPEGPDGGTFGHIDPSYIRDAVHNDFFPLARQCYDTARANDPKLGGSVVLAFNIVGDEKIGGIVEAVDVLDKSTLRDPDMIECMRQSFLSTTFPPPAGGGTVTVEYPIVFAPEDSDAGD